MNKRFLGLVLFFVFVCNAAAEARMGELLGRVSDKNGNALSFVNVVLLKSDDTSHLIKAEYTDDKGKFIFEQVPDGSYILKFVLVGYDSYTSAPLNITNNNVTIPDVRLAPNSRSLKEVSVTALKPFIEVKADKIVVNVENSIVSAGSSAMDVLARSPGVTVDQNDRISLKGKQGVNVMINGKIQPMSATDLANLLKSLPSNAIDKIEVISNPSAKYDAAGTAGIINIVMKKDQKMGWNGSVNAGYGQGVYPKEYGGFNLNYRDAKFNVYANYNIAQRKGLNAVSFDRQFFTGGQLNGEFQQNNYTTILFNTNIASAGIDYNVSKRTTIGAALNLETLYLGSTGNYFAAVLDSTRQEQSSFATQNGATGYWDNYGVNLNMKHNFDSAGRELTVDADYARYWNKNYQDFTTDYRYPDGSLMHSPSLLHGDVNGLTQIYSVKADYTMPMKHDLRLEMGMKSSIVTADNTPSFYDRSDGGNRYDSSKSDHFIYYENINAAYFNASKDWKKWSTQLGLRAEQTIAKGDEKITNQVFNRNYLNLFPSLAVQRHLNKDNDLGITLSRRIERPGYDALNPYKFFVDPSTYKVGNPYLQPALSYSAELSHVYKQRLVTSVNYTITDNSITEVLQPSLTQDRVTIQTQENITHMIYIGLSGSYTLPFYKWWSNVSNINAYYAKYQGDLANTNLDKGKPTFNINTTNRFMLPKDWTAEITFFYQAPQLYGYLDLHEEWSLNLGVQKNLLNRRATLRLNITDIFWRNNASGSSVYTNYYENFYTHHDTRQANLSFTYRFGKNTVAPVRKHDRGAEDEIRRAESGGKG